MTSRLPARSRWREPASNVMRIAIVGVSLPRALAGAVLGPLLFVVPGPNLVAYYFWFLAVGHLLAWRGAKHGIGGVKWRTRASAPLVDLRGILELDPDARATHVRDVESVLELEHLAAFVERMVVRFR